MRMNRVFLVILLFSMCQSVSARIIRVSQSGNGADGNSWATAYQLISTAVSSASPSDTIWVKNGTYNDGILVEINVRILGGFLGNETDDEEELRNPVANPTIINGGGLDHAMMGCLAACVIDGFIMKNAASTGILVYNGANPTFSRCRIEGNYPIEGKTFGGGVAVSNATPTFIDCIIIDNNGTQGGGIVILDYSTVNMTNCTISNNVSYNGGGGGIACVLSNITMENCIVKNNQTYSTASEEPVSIGGGVLVAGKGNVALLRNCLIANNWATKWNQLVIGESPQPYVSLDNCTIIGDQVKDIYWETVPPTMTNCILWGSNGLLSGEQGEADISFSCIQGGYNGFGNISDDPLFRDSANGDYRLQPLSPCIDTAGTSGPSDDLNGNPRPVDIAGLGREVTDTYDMGAYEFQLNELPTPTPTEVPAGVDPGRTGWYQ